jgi:hypothetical protein
MLAKLLAALRGESRSEEPTRNKAKPKVGGAVARKAATPSGSGYAAVAIVPGRSECCRPAKVLSGQRLLAAEAPPLPLPACTSPGNCRCRYEKFADRRDEMRRMDGIAQQLFAAPERRKRVRGRRRTDAN